MYCYLELIFKKTHSNHFHRVKGLRDAKQSRTLILLVLPTGINRTRGRQQGKAEARERGGRSPGSLSNERHPVRVYSSWHLGSPSVERLHCSLKYGLHETTHVTCPLTCLETHLGTHFVNSGEDERKRTGAILFLSHTDEN